MSESYSWPEGVIALYSGHASPVTSAILAYVRNVNANLVRGWVNRETMAGGYYDVFTGQRADMTIGELYSYGASALRMIESATALHIKLNHTSIVGSAGLFFYSGRVDSMALQGAEDGIFEWTLTYHANAWSAF